MNSQLPVGASLPTAPRTLRSASKPSGELSGVDGVSEVYDCPDKRYNSLCARLGDLPLAEIDAYGSDGDGLVIAGAPARR